MGMVKGTWSAWLQGAHMLAASLCVGGVMAVWLRAAGEDRPGGGAVGAGGGFGRGRAVRLWEMVVLAVLGAAGCLAFALLYGLVALCEWTSRAWMGAKPGLSGHRPDPPGTGAAAEGSILKA